MIINSHCFNENPPNSRIIKKVKIDKFRGFHNQEFELGSQLTAIAGQNGTQKSTLLGIITQTFTISKTNPMVKEVPLSGGSYRSAFSEKFRLSPTFDKPGEHEWTLSFDNHDNFTIESIPRSGSENVRFWQKGKRGSGDGYLQYPTIFLSMKRLTPIAEEAKISTSESLLSEEEEKDFERLHNKILIITDNNHIKKSIGLTSSNKQTLGVNTDYYDWNQNSAGQDNLGKIILALFSFRRLQSKYPNDYKGGILAIDELDATMYPASQKELLRVLRKFASELSLQIVFTTHSQSLLEEMNDLYSECSKKEQTKGQIKTLFLDRCDSEIVIKQDPTLKEIMLNLNVEVAPKPQMPKIMVFTEDREAMLVAKNLLRGRTKNLHFVDVTMSCAELLELSYKKVPGFKYPHSIIILDGDVQTNSSYRKKLKKCDNVLVLPGDKSPERMIAHFVNGLSNSHPFWLRCGEGYTKQVCFRTYQFRDIVDEEKSKREIAKKWFNEQLRYWGTNANEVIKAMKTGNKTPYEDFVTAFDNIIKRF